MDCNVRGFDSSNRITEKVAEKTKEATGLKGHKVKQEFEEDPYSEEGEIKGKIDEVAGEVKGKAKEAASNLKRKL